MENVIQSRKTDGNSAVVGHFQWKLVDLGVKKRLNGIDNHHDHYGNQPLMGAVCDLPILSIAIWSVFS